MRLFLEEARLVAMLDHPHVAQVFDVVQVDDNYVLVMEYVHGKDVRSMLLRTAQRLFLADNDLAVIQRILHAGAPLPSTLRPECPPELDRITAKALAVEADRRYQTADELARDLAEVQAPRGASTRSLRDHMQQLFEPEIAAWREAQEAGLTLVDHVAAAGPDLWIVRCV